MQKNIIIGISGASGAIYAIRLLEVLKDMNIATHLVISKAGMMTIHQETNYSLKQIQNLATQYYHIQDIGSRIASGSFNNSGMIIAPCSIKTLSSIACGFEDNLISRAAGVALKERRKLVLMVREVPLSSIHLENMLKLSNCGAIIAPPVPAFYNLPKTIEDLVDHTISRVLDLFDLDTKLIQRWDGMGQFKQEI